MKRFFPILVVLLAGCPKPSAPRAAAPPPAPPIRIVSPWAPKGQTSKSAPALAGPVELDRNNPEYIAMRDTFARAKSGYVGGNYRALFESLVPSSRLFVLNKVARWAEGHARVDDQAAELAELLRRNKVPDAAPGQSQAAWSSVVDPARTFAELMKWITAQMWEVEFIDASFAGEARVFEIGFATVRAAICLPGEPVAENTTWRHFVRVDGKWYLSLE